MSIVKQLFVTTKSAGATLTLSEAGDIIVNSSTPVTLTLPSPVTPLWYRITNVGAGAVTVSYNSTTLATIAQNGQAFFQANGTSGYHTALCWKDVTKAIIEALLTGEISSHTHAEAYVLTGAALPTASVDYRGKVFTVLGGTGVTDIPYMCIKNTSDAYEWVAI